MEDRKLNTQLVATPPGAPTQTLSPAVRAAVEHIGNNHESRIRLIDLAVIAAQTRFQLIRAFRREIGTTPHAYLVRVRVLAGTLRLAAGEPISSIATAVGFVDQTHFTRHFKRLHGTTPHEYRLGAARFVGAGGGRYAATAC
jgi:transcriptional regulator GlxA family with amidase domain